MLLTKDVGTNRLKAALGAAVYLLCGPEGYLWMREEMEAGYELAVVKEHIWNI